MRHLNSCQSCNARDTMLTWTRKALMNTKWEKLHQIEFSSNTKKHMPTKGILPFSEPRNQSGERTFPGNPFSRSEFMTSRAEFPLRTLRTSLYRSRYHGRFQSFSNQLTINCLISFKSCFFFYGWGLWSRTNKHSIRLHSLERFSMFSENFMPLRSDIPFCSHVYPLEWLTPLPMASRFNLIVFLLNIKILFFRTQVLTCIVWAPLFCYSTWLYKEGHERKQRVER